jgi:hypothetical protein
LKARMLLAATSVVVAAATAACSGLGGNASASPSSAMAVSPSPHVGLDAAVPTPAGFPADVPVYPGARLTAGAAFPSTAETTFGMEWETLDTIDKVHTFYAAQLNQGDWTISFSGSTGTAFSAVFSRKSNSRETGVLAADGSSGVTKISLSLVSPG